MALRELTQFSMVEFSNWQNTRGDQEPTSVRDEAMRSFKVLVLDKRPSTHPSWQSETGGFDNIQRIRVMQETGDRSAPLKWVYQLKDPQKPRRVQADIRRAQKEVPLDTFGTLDALTDPMGFGFSREMVIDVLALMLSEADKLRKKDS